MYHYFWHVSEQRSVNGSVTTNKDVFIRGSYLRQRHGVASLIDNGGRLIDHNHAPVQRVWRRQQRHHVLGLQSVTAHINLGPDSHTGYGNF